jgi:predicted ATPase/class 3 adenylate cyclase
MAELPSGTVTFLFTDIEGSTALWEEAPEAMRAALARHDVLFEQAVQEHAGVHIRPRGEGDSRFAVFASAPAAVAAAIAIQRAFAAEPWPTPRPIKVRIGVHTGEAELRDGDYYGSAVNRCARLRGIGHGGQVLLSEATTVLVRGNLPSGVRLRDEGKHRLKDLTQPEHVFQVTVPDLSLSFPPLVSLDARPHNLPIHPTVLLGRERAVAAVCTLLRQGARLVTLTGPGGTGKTRLGIQVAADLLDRFEHGVFLVELAPISDPALVPATIAQMLGLRDLGGRPVLDTLREYLRARSVLLVLDNFEQILPAAPVVADLLATSPGLRVLVTSREPLRLRGEHEYAVPPLALPEPRQVATVEVASTSPAVALFVQRAQAIRTDFALTDENAPAVAVICARLDGLPLAIELASARVRTLTPQVIVERVERRLPLLTGGARDLPARQQTLRATIDWSHDLLSEQEQRLFGRLSVFVAGCTLEAAEVVCNPGTPDVDVVSGLESLAVKSLIRQSDDPDSEPRFAMLETIREYALERLGEGSEMACQRRRHATYFLAVAERAEPQLHGPEQRHWLNRLEVEHGNLRAALQWTVQEDEAEIGLRLGGALAHFWEVRGHHTEGRAHLTRVLQLTGARAFPAPRANVLRNLGFLAHDQGDYAEARACHQESLAIMRDLGDRRGVARAQAGLAWVAFQVGDFALSRTLQEESLAIMRELGDREGAALALNGLGYIASVQSNHAEARTYHEESLAIMRDLGERRAVARSLAHLGWARINQRDHAGARTLLVESLTIIRGIGDPLELMRVLKVAVDLAFAVDNMDLAARLQGAIDGLRDSVGAPVSPRERMSNDVNVGAMRAALGESRFAAAWAEGRAMTLEQAVAYALDEPTSPEH